MTTAQGRTPSRGRVNNKKRSVLSRAHSPTFRQAILSLLPLPEGRRARCTRGGTVRHRFPPAEVLATVPPKGVKAHFVSQATTVRGRGGRLESAHVSLNRRDVRERHTRVAVRTSGVKMTRIGVALHDRRHKGVEGRSCAPRAMQVRPSFEIRATTRFGNCHESAPARCGRVANRRCRVCTVEGKRKAACEPGLKVVTDRIDDAPRRVASRRHAVVAIETFRDTFLELLNHSRYLHEYLN